MSRRSALAAAAVMTIAGSAFASPTIFTGNPATDGWDFQGNSLSASNYIRGGGGYDYGVYTSSFTLGAGSNMAGGGWSAGDTILGAGGVVNGFTPGNISQSLRIVTKFGADPNAWPGSSGSFSGGAGGNGAILLGTYSPANASSGGHFNPGTAQNFMSPGVVHQMPLAQRYDSGTSSISTTIGKLLFTFDADNVLSSWQVLLNLTVLESLLAPGEELPSDLSSVNSTLQRSNNSSLFTDARGGFETAESVVIPLPGAAGMALAGMGMIGLRRRR